MSEYGGLRAVWDALTPEPQTLDELHAKAGVELALLVTWLARLLVIGAATAQMGDPPTYRRVVS